jgi:hypothetical protein
MTDHVKQAADDALALFARPEFPDISPNMLGYVKALRDFNRECDTYQQRVYGALISNLQKAHSAKSGGR